ncbi:MAG: biotin--[acetyl-CoA-carboxylase] ligase, partial [Nocardia sp.]|nr:biotin--[acetyl-CoA-carboxylase] ligase [Nocardia sp.]
MRRALAEDPDLSSFFSRIDVVESTGSTNADLIARAADPAADHQVLIAEYQDSGRGRHDRSWVCPARAQVAMSILVRLRGIDPPVLGWLPLLTGVAIVDAVRETTGLDAKLKWPNDILIDGRKTAGILAEVATAAAEPAVVVGIGLNVSLTEAELPVPHAISLELAGAGPVDRTELALAMLRSFARHITEWRSRDWDIAGPAREYRRRCATLGAQV